MDSFKERYFSLAHSLNEARRKKSETEEEPVTDPEAVVVAGKRNKKVDTEKLVGKKPEAASNGTFAVDEPTDDDLMRKIDMKTATENIKNLEVCIKSKSDFFIIGRAGWGKTSLIKKMAKRKGLSIITVYLDKCVATDLAGIPVPVQNADGSAKEVRCMPAWADYMHNHPEKKFLLFFDEMNQAAPDVQNALMPIVLDHRICDIYFDNYFVGAAGNYHSENTAVEELSGPLKDRFDFFEWETNTDSTWEDTINFLRKEWEPKVGKVLMDVIGQNYKIFENPRDVERYSLDWLYKLYQEGDNDWMSVNDVQKHLTRKLRNQEDSGLSRKEYDDAVKEVATAEWNYIQKGPEQEKAGRARRGTRGAGTIDAETINCMKEMLEEGVQYVDGINYGIAIENIGDIFENPDESPLTAEQIEWFKDNLDSLNIKAKYKKVSDFIKDGYVEYKG